MGKPRGPRKPGRCRRTTANIYKSNCRENVQKMFFLRMQHTISFPSAFVVSYLFLSKKKLKSRILVNRHLLHYVMLKQSIYIGIYFKLLFRCFKIEILYYLLLYRLTVLYYFCLYLAVHRQSMTRDGTPAASTFNMAIVPKALALRWKERGE